MPRTTVSPAFLRSNELGQTAPRLQEAGFWGGWVSLCRPVLSCVAEFCLLEGKSGGFEHERSIDSIFLDPLSFREFAFGDMADAALPVPKRLLSVLKEGTASRAGHGGRMADGALYPRR